MAATVLAARWHESAIRLSAMILGASLALVVLLTPAYSDATFYLLPTRMWELCVGAVLVQTELRPHVRIAVARTFAPSPSAKAAVGLSLIAIAACLAQDSAPARLLWLMAAVVGTALVISARGAWLNRRVLARDAVVWVGLISYPLYLWHWPLLSFATLAAGRASTAQLGVIKFAIVLLAFILAWATWRWVERPVRRLATVAAGESGRNRMVIALSLCGLIMTGAVGWLTWDRARFSESEAAVDGPMLDGEALFPGVYFHRLSAADSVILVLGDSHADHLIPGLAREARRHGFGVSHIGQPSCPGVRVSVRLWGMPDLYAKCQWLADSALSHFLRDHAVKVVVLAARGSLYTSGTDGVTVFSGADSVSIPREIRMRALHDGYSSAIGRIEGAGKRTVIVLDVPEFRFDPYYCVNRFRPTTLLVNQCSTSRSANDDRQRDFRALVRQLQAEFPRLMVFDPMPLFCDALRCYSTRDGHLMFKDRNHVTDRGSRLIAEGLGALLFSP